jgi:hypothetical protein
MIYGVGATSNAGGDHGGLEVGRFFGGVCVASKKIRRFTFEKQIKKLREKSTSNNASPMHLVVGAGSCWVVPIAGFRGSNGLLAHFFCPGGLKSLFSKKC